MFHNVLIIDQDKGETTQAKMEIEIVFFCL